MANAARSLLREPAVNGPIWAVSMVKNESDIVEETIQNLLDQGVDHILVADNGSTDSTRAILSRLSQAGRVHVVDDPIVAYWQGDKMSHLARAATRMGAAWIVPFDADEMWKGEDGLTVATVLRAAETNVVAASWWDFVPLAVVADGPIVRRFPYRRAAPHPQQKIAFRANWLARISVGNHGVSLPDMRVGGGLRIAHFRTRTAAQVFRKAQDGIAARREVGGKDSSLPQWFVFEGKQEADVADWMRQLVDGEDLVLDPAELW